MPRLTAEMMAGIGIVWIAGRFLMWKLGLSYHDVVLKTFVAVFGWPILRVCMVCKETLGYRLGGGRFGLVSHGLCHSCERRYP